LKIHLSPLQEIFVAFLNKNSYANKTFEKQNKSPEKLLPGFSRGYDRRFWPIGLIIMGVL